MIAARREEPAEPPTGAGEPTPDDADDAGQPGAAGGAGRLTPEDVEDAEVDGDRPFVPGTARAALSHRAFRRVFTGFATSNVGSWMQSVVLNAYAFELTSSAPFVSIMNFATLGPLLVVTLVGGTLADRLDRRRLIMAVSVGQALLTAGLAVLVRDPEPSRAALIALVFAINCGQAVAAPTFSAALPGLVDRRDLPGAVSLISANMNLSRVLGAAVGPLVYARWGVSWVFAVNALSYLFVIAGVASVRFPRLAPARSGRGLRAVVEGFAVVARDPIKTRILVTCATFSFFSLTFIAWMPVLAERNLGIAPRSGPYGLLFATFGLGAAAGSLSLGTFLAGRDLARLVRRGLAVFAVALAVFALGRWPAPAYPVVFVVGYAYFLAVTSLSTLLQSRLEDHDRGRVMAIWIMAFGGVVSIGPLALGPLAEATSTSTVVVLGAGVALALAWYARLHEPAAPGAVTGEAVAPARRR